MPDSPPHSQSKKRRLSASVPHSEQTADERSPRRLKESDKQEPTSDQTPHEKESSLSSETNSPNKPETKSERPVGEPAAKEGPRLSSDNDQPEAGQNKTVDRREELEEGEGSDSDSLQASSNGHGLTEKLAENAPSIIDSTTRAGSAGPGLVPSDPKITPSAPPDSPNPKSGSALATSGSVEPSLTPPAPTESAPSNSPEDDGWEPVWDPTSQAFYFFNRFTQTTQWENPRMSKADGFNNPEIATASTGSANLSDTTPHPPPPSDVMPPTSRVAGGYNPAIHGDYDPNADYAVRARKEEEEAEAAAIAARTYALQQMQQMAAGSESAGPFPHQKFKNPAYLAADLDRRGIGRSTRVSTQEGSLRDGTSEQADKSAPSGGGPLLYSYFDVDAVANEHDGRSLKAERAGKRLSKAEIKAYRQKKEARKREKQMAWLRS